MLTAKELAGMRSTVAGSLPDLCTVQTVTRAADGQGGFTEAWANTYTNVPCRLRTVAIPAKSSLQGGQFQVASAWHLIFRYDQAMSTGSRVVLGGQTYEVISVEDSTSQRVHRTAFLRRLD